MQGLAPTLFASGLGVSAALWGAVLVRMSQIRKALLLLDPRPAAEDGPSPTDDPAPLVSILVPARNEEKDLGPTLRALLAQDHPNTELIVVDDESTDDTLAVAQRIAGTCGVARVVQGRPRPSGEWVGKSWALAQAVEGARGEYLLFSDADVVHHPQALRLALEEMLRLQVDAISIMPSIDCRSRWEKMLMPLFAMMAALLEAVDKANRPDLRNNRFSGAFILIRRDAYEAVGGHAAVRTEIMEDMALARRLKEAGRRVRLVCTHELSRTRMYDRLSDTWEGLARFIYPILKHSPALLLLALGAAFFGVLLPWAAMAIGLLRGGGTGWTVAATGLALAVMPAIALRDFYRLLRVHRGWSFTLPVAATILSLAATWSAWCHHSGRGVSWKSRVYRTGA